MERPGRAANTGPAPPPADRWRSIGWKPPWFDGWREPGRAVLQRWPPGAPLATALRQQLASSGAFAGFVPASGLPSGEPYECFIARTGCVPTRDNPHDFFNGLVWLRFPQAKRRLNALQAEAIARDGIQGARGPLRDALTLFDENGALLDAPPPLWAALRARDWRRLFVTERARWREARLLLFGHALLEKLVSAPKQATAHVLLAQPAINLIAIGDAAIDAALLAALQPARLAQKPFAPAAGSRHSGLVRRQRGPILL